MASQIHKLTHCEDSETWYGSIWNDSEGNFTVASSPLPYAFPLQSLRLKLVTGGEKKIHKGVCTIPWSPSELLKLQVFQAFRRV